MCGHEAMGQLENLILDCIKRSQLPTGVEAECLALVKNLCSFTRNKYSDELEDNYTGTIFDLLNEES